MLEAQVGVDAATTARLLGLLVPLLVALIAKRSASSGLKGVLNVLGSAIIGSATYLVGEDGESYNWTGFVNGTLDTLIPSVAAYYALWKPTGLAGTVTNATAGFGLGSPPTMQTDDLGAESMGVEETSRTVSRRRRDETGEASVPTMGLGLICLGIIIGVATDADTLAWVIAGVGIIVLLVGLVRRSSGRSRY